MSDVTRKPALTGMCYPQFVQLCEAAGVKHIHAEHLLASVFRHGITDVDAIPKIPASLRTYLHQHTNNMEAKCITIHQSEDGTQKFLLAMPEDETQVETVLIPSSSRLTQCISTQAGCAMACTFCLTATAGLTRHLNAAEMVAQIRLVANHSGHMPRNLVLMGMGEPLHNYDAVSQFIRIVTDPLGMAFSPRRVTVSTAGVIPGIERMMQDQLPCNLAVSLNATSNAVRNRIMPINKRWPIAELLSAVRDYAGYRKGKRVLIEYILLKDMNDTDADAHRLLELLHDISCTINLLPFNAFKDAPYARPDRMRVDCFRRILSDGGRVAVIRESRGREIHAACGQLVLND